MTWPGLGKWLLMPGSLMQPINEQIGFSRWCIPSPASSPLSAYTSSSEHRSFHRLSTTLQLVPGENSTSDAVDPLEIKGRSSTGEIWFMSESSGKSQQFSHWKTNCLQIHFRKIWTWLAFQICFFQSNAFRTWSGLSDTTHLCQAKYGACHKLCGKI